jgi:hypothetical protein
VITTPEGDREAPERRWLFYGDTVELREVAKEASRIAGRTIPPYALRRAASDGLIEVVGYHRGKGRGRGRGFALVTRADAQQIAELLIFCVVVGMAIAAAFKAAQKSPELLEAARKVAASVPIP